MSRVVAIGDERRLARLRARRSRGRRRPTTPALSRGLGGAGRRRRPGRALPGRPRSARRRGRTSARPAVGGLPGMNLGPLRDAVLAQAAPTPRRRSPRPTAARAAALARGAGRGASSSQQARADGEPPRGDRGRRTTRRGPAATRARRARGAAASSTRSSAGGAHEAALALRERPRLRARCSSDLSAAARRQLGAGAELERRSRRRGGVVARAGGRDAWTTRCRRSPTARSTARRANSRSCGGERGARRRVNGPVVEVADLAASSMLELVEVGERAAARRGDRARRQPRDRAGVRVHRRPRARRAGRRERRAADAQSSARACSAASSTACCGRSAAPATARARRPTATLAQDARGRSRRPSWRRRASGRARSSAAVRRPARVEHRVLVPPGVRGARRVARAGRAATRSTSRSRAVGGHEVRSRSAGRSAPAAGAAERG